jgi:Uma2 family endonuclease
MEMLAKKHLFTVTEFHQMGEIFSEDDRVELIEGEIIEMAAIGNYHLFCVNALTNIITSQIQGIATISVQNPIYLNELSEPQPDLTILQGHYRRYFHHRATASDVLLLIEVADSSYRYDQKTKIPLYARHSIAEVWLFDLTHQTVEVYNAPQPSGYSQRQIARAGQQLSPRLLPKVVVNLTELFEP